LPRNSAFLPPYLANVALQARNLHPAEQPSLRGKRATYTWPKSERGI
jgi:hypothetical protein